MLVMRLEEQGGAYRDHIYFFSYGLFSYKRHLADEGQLKAYSTWTSDLQLEPI